MTVIVRRAASSDIPAIQSIGLLTWPATYLPFTSPQFVLANLNSWWSESAVRQTVEEDTTFVACAGKSVVGTVTVGQFEGEAVIWKIYVLPAEQGRGIGAALMDAAVESTGESCDVRLEYVKGNEHARGFYERSGFAFDFEEDPGDGSTTVWMRRKASSAMGPKAQPQRSKLAELP